MYYKIGCLLDLVKLPFLEQELWKHIYELTMALSSNYGDNRDIEENDGGYILLFLNYVDTAELKTMVNYQEHIPEYVTRIGKSNYCEAVYLFSNEYAVSVILPVSKAPVEILEELQ